MPYSVIYNFATRLRNRHFFLIDLLILLSTPLAALYLRIDGDIDFTYFGSGLIQAAVLFTVSKLAVFYLLGLYRRFWRTASIDELGRLLIVGITAVFVETIIYIYARNLDLFALSSLPQSLAVIDGILSFIFISTLRLSIRLLERANERIKVYKRAGGGRERVLVIGAGYAGAAIVQEMQRKPELALLPVAFIDDDRGKKNMRIRGVPVVGEINLIAEVVGKCKITKIIIAMPSAPGSVIRKIAAECNKINVDTLTVPGIYEILNGKVSIDTVRKIQVEDLLRREPIRIDSQSVARQVQGKRILVTGAGGSIGSEICRQLLKYNASEIILFGHGENSIFEIEQELKAVSCKNNYDVKITSKIADIRHKERVREIFSKTEPEIVFHAAAHKHVPLMELNPKEAVTNNIFGTKYLVELSLEYGVEHFVFISSDKAVNPTNIMGTTKRVAEMIVLDAAREFSRRFTAVRFGNVLGSRGSVLNTFKKQIASGGPLTVTHPEITRYFITIPEAVQLVLQASVLSKGGEIFMLDMGESVKLHDLAKDIIRYSGFKEGVDINIEFTGLRPGEKLYEELFVKGERYEKTEHEKLLIAANASNFVNSNLNLHLEDLYINLSGFEGDTIYKKMRELVPEFNPVYNNGNGGSEGHNKKDGGVKTSAA